MHTVYMSNINSINNRYAPDELRIKTRPMTGKHACPECGSIISDRFEFCAHVAFGREIDEGCRRAFEKFWAAHKSVASAARR